MLIPRTNIETRLARVRDREAAEVLAQVKAFLEAETGHERRIARSLETPPGKTYNEFDFDLLERGRIYHLDHIRTICIDYRLRFLDSRYFKGELPREAMTAIRRLERDHGTELQGFKILAPSRLFKLEDKDDPLLFVPMGNNYYYLIHKWGNDLHPLRKVFAWPFKNIVNLTLLVVLISYLCTLLVPSGLFTKSDSQAEFWIIFFFMFKSIAAVVIFYGFALGKNFNPAIWNSKYFNA